MRTLLFLALIGTSCGHRSIIDLTDAKATRHSDDRVSVVETATCQTMIGHSDCGSLCVTASWISSTGGSVDTVTACDPTLLTNGTSKRFTLVSKLPIPSGTLLRVNATSSYAGTWQALPYEGLSP